MKLSAKADYAVRAVLVLAIHEGEGSLKGEIVAKAQDLPLKFVENILGELKHAGVVASQRGPDGGYRLARPREPGLDRRRDPDRGRADRRRRRRAARRGHLPARRRGPPGRVARGSRDAALGARDDHVRRSRGAIAHARGQGDRRAPRTPARRRRGRRTADRERERPDGSEARLPDRRQRLAEGGRGDRPPAGAVRRGVDRAALAGRRGADRRRGGLQRARALRRPPPGAGAKRGGAGRRRRRARSSSICNRRRPRPAWRSSVGPASSPSTRSCGPSRRSARCASSTPPSASRRPNGWCSRLPPRRVTLCPPAVARRLVELVGEDIGDLALEIDKLIVYCARRGARGRGRRGARDRRGRHQAVGDHRRVGPARRRGVIALAIADIERREDVSRVIAQLSAHVRRCSGQPPARGAAPPRRTSPASSRPEAVPDAEAGRRRRSGSGPPSSAARSCAWPQLDLAVKGGSRVERPLRARARAGRDRRRMNGQTAAAAVASRCRGGLHRPVVATRLRRAAPAAAPLIAWTIGFALFTIADAGAAGRRRPGLVGRPRSGSTT